AAKAAAPAADAKPASKTAAAKPAAKPAAKAAGKPAAKTAAKAKAKSAASADDADLSDIEAELETEPVVVSATGEKVKPLRMKISKAKERALMKEFGLEETI
ncbi:RNA polymerase sigma factor RpoD, partial [bacterium]|nr:RNA polymerase sigma factor RpoD [bacterium]